MSSPGQTQVVGLIGWPVHHSLSPVMHNAAFAALGLDWRYVLWPVPVLPCQRLGEAIAGIRALGLRGANVTVPHKQSALRVLDHVSDAARLIGAVNTLWVDDQQRLCGDNTDAPGLHRDLLANDVELHGAHALILGAGGSSRAALVALAHAGCRQITTLNRTRARAEALVSEFIEAFPDVRLEAGGFPGDLQRASADASLIVNCTPLGMAPAAQGLPWDRAVPLRADQVVYDLIYNPSQTGLITLARDAGARAFNGLGMLLEQGALAFERWTGQAAPRDVMRAALLSSVR